MKPQPLLKDAILQGIKQKGGWVNTHAHFDRAYTVNEETLFQGAALMEEKWTLVDPMKKASSEEDYFLRIEKAVQHMIAQGVTVAATFIDVDAISELRAIKAAHAVREKYAQQIKLLFMNQVTQGVVDGEGGVWAQKALEYVDIVGATPSKDRPNADKNIDRVLAWAKDAGKMAHVHIDQENNPNEQDTQLLVKKTIEHGMQGKVVAVHAVSIARQPKEKRQELYRAMKEAGMMVTCSPSAALSMKALPYTSEISNSIVPVPELLAAGIPVALGTDNISDIFQPLIDGDMYTELRVLAEACRFYDLAALTDVATIHGRRTLGIS